MVVGLLRICKALATCLLALNFLISSIAFLSTVVRSVTVVLGALDSVIREYALKTSRVGIRPLGPAESLIALKAICRAISLVISGSSTEIIR